MYVIMRSAAPQGPQGLLAVLCCGSILGVAKQLDMFGILSTHRFSVHSREIKIYC